MPYRRARWPLSALGRRYDAQRLIRSAPSRKTNLAVCSSNVWSAGRYTRSRQCAYGHSGPSRRGIRLARVQCSCYVRFMDMLSLGQDYPPASRRRRHVGQPNVQSSFSSWEAETLKLPSPAARGPPRRFHVTLVPVAPFARAANPRTRSGPACPSARRGGRSFRAKRERLALAAARDGWRESA